jgi:hypothetical protein
LVDIQGVTGSNPVSPTIKSLKYMGFFIGTDDLRLNNCFPLIK